MAGGAGATQSEPRDDEAVGSPEGLLSAIIEHYLGSGDFNGLPLGSSSEPHTYLEGLIRAGQAQLVTEKDWMNTHIRPWATATDLQLERLGPVLRGELGACLYPTPEALAGRDLAEYRDRPFLQRRAEGQGDLELVFLRMPAIEDYRNDPRYVFEYGDFDVHFGIGDDAYLDDDEPDTDKIPLVRAGFAYDASVTAMSPGPIHRYVCAFLKDLSRLSAIHQVRLQTWEQPDADDLKPHPIWWQNQMGEWGEYVGPFDKILVEIEAINAIWAILFGKALFRTTDRPRDWGWVLRPSTNEWDRFVLLTDQLLSDNLDKDALDACGAPKQNAKGQALGTLGRLETYLARKSSAGVEDAFKVFKDVRRYRNKPAHAARQPINDRTLVVRQRDLLFEIADSLAAVRRFMATHPKVRAKGWRPPAYIDKWLLL